MRSLLSRRRGGNAVEFALTLPLMCVIMGLTVDYGWFFHNQFHLTNACNVSAQAAAASYANSQDGISSAMVGSAAGQDAWTATGLEGQPAIAVVTRGAVPDLVFEASCSIPFDQLFNTQALMNLVPGASGAAIIPGENKHVAVRRGMNQMVNPDPV